MGEKFREGRLVMADALLTIQRRLAGRQNSGKMNLKGGCRKQEEGEGIWELFGAPCVQVN
jgi:hypothetical protein